MRKHVDWETCPFCGEYHPDYRNCPKCGGCKK